MSTQEPNFIFICFGLIFLSIGILILKSTMPKMEDKKKTKGELVDYIKRYDREHGIVWNAVYEFDVDGRIYKTTSLTRFSGKWMIKKVVNIEYDDSDPTINAIPSERFLPMIFIVIGVGIIMLGLNMYLESRNVDNSVYIDSYEIHEDI